MSFGDAFILCDNFTINNVIGSLGCSTIKLEIII
jgi:hypothetical protein